MLEFVTNWIAQNRPALPSLYLSPDFLLAPDLLLVPSKEDMRALAERCKKMFKVEMVVDFASPPAADKKLILLAHEFWDFRECAISPHCLLLPVLYDDSAQTVLRQLIVLRLAHAVYDGDLRCASWLFEKRKSIGIAPIYLMHRDFEFEGAIGALLHEADETENIVDTDYILPTTATKNASAPSISI